MARMMTVQDQTMLNEGHISAKKGKDGTVMSGTLSRRGLLKRAGVAAGALSVGMGRLLANAAIPTTETVPGKTPISLIIDDGSPVDPLFYELPGYETPFLVPADFTQRVAETFERFDLRGKFTVIPMPSCLGLVLRAGTPPCCRYKGQLRRMRKASNRGIGRHVPSMANWRRRPQICRRAVR